MKFSEKMAEVEEIVNRLEREALPLEEALSLFEKGVSAIRECQVFLAEARQKVSLLTAEGETVPFPAGKSGEGKEE